MNRILNKLLDVLFNLYVRFSIFRITYFKLKKSKSRLNGIMALPYYPKNYAGGHSRIGDWKVNFNNNGIVYDVFWASDSDAFLNDYYSKNPFKRYWFFFKVLNKRLKIIDKINQYEAIWIQRSFIPFYPFNDAYFESILVKLNKNITIDYYDADYESNYNLTVKSASILPKVSVASPYLADFFKKINPNTFYLPFAINHEDYHVKKYDKSQNEIIIGWMGSPENFKNIIQIEQELEIVENNNPNVSFKFICRDKFKLNLKRYDFVSWSDKNFDYFNEIKTFDIGLAPMMNKSERNKAKTAFKSLEYMSSGLAFVSSPWGIPEHLIHENNVMIANTKQDWIDNKEKFKKLIKIIGPVAVF